MNGELEYAINRIVTKINEVLFGNTMSFYLYGLCVLDDFKIGWSDIDIFVLTPKPIIDEQAKILVSLRQALLDQGHKIHITALSRVACCPSVFSGRRQKIKLYIGEAAVEKYKKHTTLILCV